MIKGVKNNRLAELDDADYALDDPNAMFALNANAIPMPFNVQGPRVFYGARFFDQALPLAKRQSPLVRNLSFKEGRSWDYVLGRQSGAVFHDDDEEAVVEKVDPDEVVLRTASGKKVVRELYNNMPFNRNTALRNKVLVQPGQVVRKGQPLASSNFTDDEGRLAMGLNARIGLVPYKGETMDDAVVISQAFADRLVSDHSEVVEHEPDDEFKMGRNHFVSLFPQKFKKSQLDFLDDEGVVKPGTILQPGDPVILRTKPKSFSSGSADISKLSRSVRHIRKDSSLVWDGDDSAEVIDVVRGRKGGVKVLLKYESPARPGDKVALRAGGKATITRVIPNDRMPRTKDGVALDLLLNPLSLPSRVNASSYYELLLGKIAERTGKPYVLPATLPEGKSWFEFIKEELAKNGVDPEEEVFDPEEGKPLARPITVGVGHIMKLNHQAAKKIKSRGQAGYDVNRQPMKGGTDAGGAQRMSGLEMNVLHSSGARGVQREALALKGEFRDDYWRALKENRPLPRLGAPFVWEKFRVLLNGAGMHSKDLGKGRLRLVPMTDRELDRRGSMPVDSDDLVDLRTLEPKPGGVFDPRMTREGRWGHVDLPFPVINPAYENALRTLLGVSGKELQEMLDAPLETGG